MAHSGTIILLSGIPAQEVDEGKPGFLVRPYARVRETKPRNYKHRTPEHKAGPARLNAPDPLRVRKAAT